MDINTTKQIIEVAIKTRQDEITALQSSLDILNDKFAPDFTALTVAQEEANRLAGEKNAVIAEKAQAEADRDTALADKEAIALNIATETKRADDAEAKIAQAEQVGVVIPADATVAPE